MTTLSRGKHESRRTHRLGSRTAGFGSVGLVQRFADDLPGHSGRHGGAVCVDRGGLQKRQCSASAHSSPGRRNLLRARRRDYRFGWRSHHQSHSPVQWFSCRAASAHSFAIESDELRMLILATPAGLEGWFKQFSVPAPAMTLPPPAETPYSEIQKMLAAAPDYGLEFVLPKK